jgi:Dolichyl-phosphate-mannose-protein mannosyltransferase
LAEVKGDPGAAPRLERGSTSAEILVGAISLCFACAYLLAQLVPELDDQPLHIDEAVTGETATKPLADLLATVIGDRGGPPLHYLAAYVSLRIEPTADMLRWPSVVFALGTVVVCWDLGRRISGPVAGAAAALVAATSGALEAFGTFGRMYAAFALAASLAADTFYRALVLRTIRAALLAGLAAVVVAATHTYGTFLLVVEAAIAVVLWRGRPLRAGVPFLLLGLAIAPLVFAYARLSDRFEVGVNGDSALISPRTAARQLHYALGSFTGGRYALVLFILLAAVGAVVIMRRQPAFLALWIAVLAPPLLYLAVSGPGNAASPRHLVYALPLWAAHVAAGFAYLVRRFPLRGQAVLLVMFGAFAAAFQAPYGLAGDPRGKLDSPVVGSRAALAEPSAWLEQHVEPGDVLIDHSPAFLSALETTRDSFTIATGAGELFERNLERVEYPVSAVVVARAIPGAAIDSELLQRRLADRAEVNLTPPWLLIRRIGPFRTRAELLRGTHSSLKAVEDSLESPPPRVESRLERLLRAVCNALAVSGDEPATCQGTASG